MRMRWRLRRIGVALSCCLASGCASISESNQRPETVTPGNWQGGTADAAAWPDREWWRGFESRELDRLIGVAHANNHDLNAAIARVAQARADARIVRASLFPLLTVSAERQRAKPPAGIPVTNYAVAPLLSYEIDLWGRNRLAADAANAILLSSAYAQEVVRLAVIAEVANTYFQVLSLNDRIAVAEENLAIARKLLELVEVQHSLGKVSGLELERQRAQVATVEAAIPPLMVQRQIARDALAVLLGTNPGEVELLALSLRPITAPTVPLGLPSQLLERRPDIRGAEADLLAAQANIGAARAAIFPRLSLSAQSGFESAKSRTLFGSGTSFYSLAFDLLGTIFDGGALAGQVDFAVARKAELVEAYYQSVVSAFREVEDALAGVNQFTLQEKTQQQAVHHAREAYRLAQLRYKAGAVDFTTVLDAQRVLLDAESQVDLVRFARFSSVVDLYRALGGGWEPIRNVRSGS